VKNYSTQKAIDQNSFSRNAILKIEKTTKQQTTKEKEGHEKRLIMTFVLENREICQPLRKIQDK
jgi:hypothetical protein